MSRVHQRFCRLIKHAMFVTTEFPQVDAKFAERVRELVTARARLKARKRDQITAGDKYELPDAGEDEDTDEDEDEDDDEDQDEDEDIEDENDHPNNARDSPESKNELFPERELSGRDRAELAEYTAIVASWSSRKSVLLFVAFNLLIVLKYLTHLTLTSREINYHEPTSSVELLTDDDGLASSGATTEPEAAGSPHDIRFACLVTNCSRVAGWRELVESQLQYLPLFSLCHPTLSLVYSPTADLGSPGLMAHVYAVCTLSVLCVFYPVLQMYTGVSNESLMFTVAPRATTEILIRELAHLRRAYLASLENFCHICWTQSALESGPTVGTESSLWSGLSFRWRVAASRGASTQTHTMFRFGPACPLHSDSRESIGDKLALWRRLDADQLTKLEAGTRDAGDLELTCAWPPTRRPMGARQWRRLSSETAREQRLFLMDCMPSVRSYWWRAKIGRLYFQAFVIITVLMVTIFLCFFKYLASHMDRMSASSLQYERFMRERQCVTWRESGWAFVERSRGPTTAKMTRTTTTSATSKSARSALKLADLAIGWSLWDFVETAPPLAYAVYLLAIFATLIFSSCSELICWLLELERNLLFAVELVRTDDVRGQHQRQLGVAWCRWSSHMQALTRPHLGASDNGGRVQRQPRRETLVTRHLKRRFKRDTDLKLFYVHTRRLEAGGRATTKLDTRLALQQMALAELEATGEHQGAAKADEEQRLELLLVLFLEKLYLNGRLFVRLVHLHSLNIAALIMMANMGVYAFTVGAVYLSFSTRNVALLSYVVLALVLVAMFFAIGIVSQFHARARRLQPIYWSLVALLTCSRRCARSERLQHLRLVYFKQSKRLDEQGGLAVSAFNFRVTYTNVIQVLIWSSTVLVLTLKQ